MRQRRKVGNLELDFEAPEAGRYAAPIIVCPGLFQSLECWRPLTSMLAHRGWELYFLGRGPEDGGRLGWQDNIDRMDEAAAALGGQVIIFGADLGAALALAAVASTRPMALALFAPSHPPQLAASLKTARAMLERSGGPWQGAPKSVLSQSAQPSHQAKEAALLLEEAPLSDFEIPVEHPPALVFVAEGDTLVSPEESERFAVGPYSKQAHGRLAGRWWAAAGQTAVADELHRYLILTLGDRVVEFPEEILAED